MKENVKNAGTNGTTGAEDLAVILSNFGGETVLETISPQRVVAWTSPKLGRCAGDVQLVSESGWLVVTLPERDELLWVWGALVVNSDISASLDKGEA